MLLAHWTFFTDSHRVVSSAGLISIALVRCLRFLLDRPSRNLQGFAVLTVTVLFVINNEFGLVPLGALMVFLTAVRHHGVDAAVAYHGGDTEKYLGEVDGLNAPLLMHLAEEDEFISKAAQAEIKSGAG